MKRKEFRRFSREFYTDIFRLLSTLIPTNPIRITEKDWDYLILLDACRYDFFKKYCDIPGKLSLKKSCTCTEKWIKYNFSEDCDDIVVVAGNPHYAEFMLNRMLGGNPFHHVEPVFDYGWNSELGTVPPQEVNDATIKVLKEFPDKRILIHYNQPHHPFLSSPDLIIDGDSKGEKSIGVCTVWDKLKAGNINISHVKKAYSDNLNLVLDKVKDLLNCLSGDIVITSDHGNCFGEFGLYGHPRVPVRYLTRVPWLYVQQNFIKNNKKY